MRRVAWFHIVIDTEDEEVANRWLATVNVALDTFAHQAAEICRGRLEIVEASEAGQSIPVEQDEVEQLRQVIDYLLPANGCSTVEEALAAFAAVGEADE